MADWPDATTIDPSPPPQAAPPKRRWVRLLGYGFLGLWAAVALWNLFKPLPAGVSVRGTVVSTPLSDLQFLRDVTSADVFGEAVVRQQIFDAVLRMVGEAREFVVVDFFLFNAQRGAALDSAPYREISVQLRDALMARKRAVPA